MMSQTASNQDVRDLARARRRALTSKGKAALSGAATMHTPQRAPQPVRTATAATPTASARDASRTRREAMSAGGKSAIQSSDRTRGAPARAGAQPPAGVKVESKGKPAGTCGCGCDGTRPACKESGTAGRTSPVARTALRAPRRHKFNHSAGRVASLARREALSSRGKAGIGAKGLTPAQTARAGNPHLSGRELAMQLREQRSRQGKAGQKKSKPCGRIRPGAGAEPGAAQDAPWKVGASETVHGQTVTGTMVGRSRQVTGDEPSTCRAVTGTEYLGADIFREFCHADAGEAPRKVEVTSTSHGNRVTGNKVGRGRNVTGDEPGTCKRITGNEYVGAAQAEIYCGTRAEATPARGTRSETRGGRVLTGNNVGRSDKVTGDETGAARDLTGTQYLQPGDGKVPGKVGTSATLRGGSVTGTMVGRSNRVTGDEPGSCRDVTGDDYIGQEQYRDFCDRTPQAGDSKVGVSATLAGRTVTGTMTGRSGSVTGDEPGTCKTVTGTPYAGAEQYGSYCRPEEAAQAAARKRRASATPGAAMTGQQPGMGGKATGDSKGACEPVSGTPYLGADQFAEACPALAADPRSPDFPQPVGGVPWGQFSVTSPATTAAEPARRPDVVTGSRYEQGSITGPFGMASGKVTGTEEARFGPGVGQPAASMPQQQAAAETVAGRVKSRITGEGMDAGLKITGDDWERGDTVTGTEGTSAIRRNPTMRHAQDAALSAVTPHKRNEGLAVPTSKVTGGSGNTEKGALVTYSGGARG